MDEYRRLLEACTAAHILRRDVLQKDVFAHENRDIIALFNFEVNGLCMALRLLGGYGTQAFDGEWAKTIPIQDVPWETALDASYALD